VSFWKQLKERRLVQIVVSYLGALWVLLEVLDHFTDRAYLPELVYDVMLIWGIAGIPVAFLVGWHHGEKGKQRAPLSEVGIIALLVVGAFAASGMTVNGSRTAAALARSAENALEVRRIAVSYFDDQTGGEYGYLADALTEDLIAELSRVDALDVISRNGSALYRDADLAPDSVGRLLEAGTVVDGSVALRGNRLRFDLAIYDSRSGAVIQRAGFEQPVEQMLALRDSVVDESARMLRGWIGEEFRVRGRAEDAGSRESWTLVQRAEKRRKDAEASLLAEAWDAVLPAFADADGLLADAERIDPRWPEPAVQRAALAYRQARLAQNDPAEAVTLIEQGVAHADEALSRSRRSGRALELRGTLNYYRYLLRVDQDPRERDALFESARSDLTSAVQYDASLASAWGTLSHMYYHLDDVPNAVVAAQRAWESDAYLESADLVLWRLFGGSLDLMNFPQAVRWCEQGARRFGDSYRFASCRLRLMATPAVPVAELDIDRAWELLARQDSLTPERAREFERLRGRMVLAAVLARASMPDSARAVLNRARTEVTAEVDPTRELLLVEAYARTLLGEKDAAVRLLLEHEAAVPGSFSGDGAALWWWSGLQDHPEFRRLVGLD